MRNKRKLCFSNEPPEGTAKGFNITESQFVRAFENVVSETTYHSDNSSTKTMPKGSVHNSRDPDAVALLEEVQKRLSNGETPTGFINEVEELSKELS